MNTTKSAVKTVGEVEKLTGIPRRKIKYFIERGIFVPSEKSESGYWLYSDMDVEQIQVIALYKELDWPDEVLKTMLAGHDFWQLEELDRQICRLSEKYRLSENRLLAARYLRERLAASGPQPLAELRRDVLAILDGGISVLKRMKENEIDIISGGNYHEMQTMRD